MQIRLLSLEPINPNNFTTVQAELYNYLLQQRGTTLKLQEVARDMNCRITAPILKRLEHLQEKGMIAIQ